MSVHHPFTRSLAALALTLGAAACAKQDAPATDTTAALAPAPASDAAPATDSASRTPAVRGTLTAVTDSTLTVSTPSGDVGVRVVQPLKVYARAGSDLAHVTPNSFVGVTSVAQPDGSERATEIHLFPEEMRGTGEGSRMMSQASGTTGRSTMTNGTVSAGGAGASRMTNGTVNVTPGRTMTVTYAGGAQTIVIPADVQVTSIAPTTTKLATGTAVIVIVQRGAGGDMTTSAVMVGERGTGRR